MEREFTLHDLQIQRNDSRMRIITIFDTLVENRWGLVTFTNHTNLKGTYFDRGQGVRQSVKKIHYRNFTAQFGLSNYGDMNGSFDLENPHVYLEGNKIDIMASKNQSILWDLPILRLVLGVYFIDLKKLKRGAPTFYKPVFFIEFFKDNIKTKLIKNHMR